MTTTIKTLKRLFGLEPRISREQAMAAFGRRYASFNELLQSNADLAAILAKLDAAQRGDKHLETHQVRRIARKAVFHCERMAACLNDCRATVTRIWKKAWPPSGSISRTSWRSTPAATSTRSSCP